MSISIVIHPTNDCGWGDLRRELSLMTDVEIQVDSRCRHIILNQVRDSPPDILITGADYSVADPVGLLSKLRGVLPSQSKMLLLLGKVDSSTANFVSRAESIDVLLWTDLSSRAIPAFIRSYSAVTARIAGEGYLAATTMVRDRERDYRTLTARQLTIVSHLALGRSYSEISNAMNLSYRTVAREVERLMKAENASSLFQLAWGLSRSRHIEVDLPSDHPIGIKLPWV